MSPSSIRSAWRNAAKTTEPEDIPANIPSFSRRLLVVLKASKLLTRILESKRFRSKIGGMNPSSNLRNPDIRSSGSGATATLANYRSLKCLEPLALTLLYADGDLDGISRSKLLDLGIGGEGYNGT